MTDEKPEQPVEAEVETEAEIQYFVDIRDQKIQIGQAAPEQLAMMRITANRLSRLNEKTISGDEAIRAFEKAIQVVCSLPVDRSDRDWLEDLLLSREMDLGEATGIMEQATEEWASKGGNRSDRRRGGASRKKAATKKAATRK